MKRPQAFIMPCLQVILGVTQWDKERNTMFRSPVGMKRGGGNCNEEEVKVAWPH